MSTHHRFDCAVTAYLEGELDTREVVELLREAAVFAKRYEDAPVGEVGDIGKGYHRWIRIRGEPHLPPSYEGQRVRILLDTEGV